MFPRITIGETCRPEVTMDFKKLDELANGLDDLTVTVDELKDEAPQHGQQTTR